MGLLYIIHGLRAVSYTHLYEMVITERTQWQDHDEETTSDPVTLAVGEQICVVQMCIRDRTTAPG